MNKAVILNDTAISGHFGCTRVMRVLRQRLARAGIRVSATSPVRHDWEHDRGFVEALGRAALIVINGEGTLHDGRLSGGRLLRVVDHPARGATPVVLLNALYQNNPAKWQRWLSRMALIVARDSHSARELSGLLGREIEFLPDLSLCDGFACVLGPRRGVLLGDSVKFRRRRVLAGYAVGRAGVTYLPIRCLSWIRRLPPRLTPFGSWLAYNLCNGVLALRQPPKVWPRSEGEFIARLAGATMHVTGRFHGVALSLVTRTPFLALRSNSWKIDSLLHDAGLDPGRIVRPSRLPDRLDRHAVPLFTAGEQRALVGFIDTARRRADVVFERIRTLSAVS